MDDQSLWTSIFFAGLFTILILRLMPKSTRAFITDYQRGLRFVKGSFVDVKGPGSYRSRKSGNEITVVDMRPQPFLIERLFYQDGLQNPAVVSIGAELVVTDPYAAVTMVKDRFNDSVSIVRDALRIQLGRSVTDSNLEGRKNLAEKLTTEANAELSKIGMAIQNAEVTELWSRTVRGHSSRAN